MAKTPKKTNPKKKAAFEITSTLAGLGIVIGIVANMGTIVKWFAPDPPKVQGGLLIEHLPLPFHFPETYKTSGETARQFFETAEAMWRMRIINMSAHNQADLRINLPCDAIIEVHRTGQPVEQILPSTTFGLGTLGIADEITVYIWFKRRLMKDDKLLVFASGTQAVPVTVQDPADPAELESAKQSKFYLQIACVILALIAAGLLQYRRIAAWLVNFVMRRTG